MLCLSGFELYSRWVPLKAVQPKSFSLLLATLKKNAQEIYICLSRISDFVISM